MRQLACFNPLKLRRIGTVRDAGQGVRTREFQITEGRSVITVIVSNAFEIEQSKQYSIKSE